MTSWMIASPTTDQSASAAGMETTQRRPAAHHADGSESAEEDERDEVAVVPAKAVTEVVGKWIHGSLLLVGRAVVFEDLVEWDAEDRGDTKGDFERR